ncbi:MAG: VWA domain-containing protein [Campylobacterales bacterium]|nr:VWA domain-containing protein [Campylobacterales bacterium]
MSFLHPEFLYYMLPPLFILFGLLLTQKEAQLHFFSDEVLSRLRVSANILTLKARNALFFLMGFFMIVALAHPVINEGEVEVKAKSADIMVAMDISDSMLAEDVYPNRLKLAKLKAMELLKIVPNERIGVIAFAKNSYLVSPLSFDHSAVGFLLRQLDTTSITEKGTDFLSMLEVVNNSVDKEGKKYLLILSDGGDESDFSKEIAYAKEKNIVVFVLGIGTKTGAPIKLEGGTFVKHNGEIIVSKLNENISSLATKSGGVYVQSVKADDDIKTMLREIESLSEQKELKSEKVQRFIPLFYYPLGMALLLFLIATSSMTKRQTVSVPSVFILFALLFFTPQAEAGLLDFVELGNAKKAYENKEYEKASKLYEKHAEHSLNAESYYNAGNSLYKQGKFDEALKSYEKATFFDEKQRAKNLSNIGNSYVKQAKEESLQKALNSYEESLKLHEDKETRENLEEVKKAIEKQKEDKQEKKEDKSEQNKEDKNQKEGDNKDSKKQEDKDSKEKNSEEKNSSEKKEEKSDKEQESSKNDKPQESEKKFDDKKSQKENEKNKKEDSNQTKEEQQKQSQNKNEKKEDNNSASEAQSSQNISEDKMSDAEEQKWLEQLNLQQNTYMYKLNDEKSKKENSNEKPW